MMHNPYTSSHGRQIDESLAVILILISNSYSGGERHAEKCSNFRLILKPKTTPNYEEATYRSFCSCPFFIF